MDDDLGLLGGSDGPGGPVRRPWVLVTGAVLVALLTLVGAGWMVSSVLDDGGAVTAAAPTTTPAAPPSTTPVAAPEPAESESAFPTALPSTSRAPLPTFSVPVVPVPTVVTVAPTPRRPTPRVTPKPTPKPPVGLRVVPGVVGQKVRTARVVLEAAGFRVSVLGGGVFAPGRDGRRVTAQRPTAGSTAPVGSVVVLVTDGL